ncbi:P-loop NTPase fold protein [Pseudomonas sp. RIT-PI-r]|uniref:P-loop NTPase fold protein n=1 Tax=Pseudomonas sp. RIT-PI-r TaxID=1699620 RepID=UPI0007DAD086|nr:P-loop NTPase fold protein [Pseudomonas sp. RIT-PI-r]
MDILNFQSENPSGVDVFKGESHDRVAQAMHDYIKCKKNHRVIGLDGEFGSGKSSILQMLEKKISLEGSNTKLWIFDCEQNYQGSIKSNFIELFTDQITSLLKDLHRENDVVDVVKNRDIALGRHFSYTKDTRSHISIWAVLLIASGVLSPTFIRDYLPQLRGSIELEWWKHMSYLAASLAPAIILGLAFFFNRKNQPGKKRWNISSLLKGSSDDHISETIEISKEVSPLDLKRALAKHLHSVKDHHFIIVIDNLDRLPRDVLRSVWSDLEIFTSVTGTENLSVIVPFCSSKVSKYLNGEGEQSYDSKDFIAKKFPVVFRTPPIITSGWKDAFRTLWSQSFGANNIKDADTCSVILQRHSPMAGGLVTPRLQKRFINDIATTLLVTADKPSVVCIAAYIAICKYNNISIEAMLKRPDSAKSDNNVPIGETEAAQVAALNLVLSIDKTKLTLKALLGEDMKAGWPIQILQIHFQTSADIAIAELIDQPLANAFESQDGKKLASLIPYFGFMDSFVRGLDGGGAPSNIFQTLYQASKIEDCSIDALLPYVSDKFSSSDQLTKISPENGYFDAIKGLISLGLRKSIFESSLADAKRAFEQINNEAFNVESVDSYQATISRYDHYLDSMGNRFEPLTLDSSEVLFHMIVPDPDLKVINPNNIAFSSKGLRDAVLQIASTEAVDFVMTPLNEEDWQHCLVAYFGKVRLSLAARNYFLNDEQTASVTTAIDINPAEERLWLAAVFFKEYTSSVPVMIQRHLSAVTSPYIKIAMAVIYMRQNLGAPLSEIPAIEKAFEEEPEFLEALVRAATTSDNLLKLTLQGESSHLVAPILAKLIKDEAIANVYSREIFASFTELCEILFEYDISRDEFLSWFTSFHLNPTNLPSLGSLDSLILKEILVASNATLLQLRGALLDKHFGPQVDAASWLKIIENADANEEAVLRFMVDMKLDFLGEKFSRIAVSSFLSTTVKTVPFVAPSVAAVSNTKSVLQLFDNDTCAVLGTELRAFVFDQSTSVESSIFILSEFGALLSSVTPRTAVEEERLLQILAAMHSNPETTSATSDFLDSRAAQLANWTISKDYKDTYASLVTKLKARMPKIYEDLSTRHGFRTRMNDLAKAILGK